LSFDACVEAYLNAHKAGWRNPKHRQQWENTLKTYASPVFGAFPVRNVDVGLIVRVLEPIWASKPETASRLRGRIESVLSWATIRGYRTGDNPARWRRHLDQLLPPRSKMRQVRHHPALAYTELPAFMAELRGCQGVAARALEFLILTAVRTGDVIGNNREDASPMRSEHVDLREQVWTIPKTKTNTEHRVPLSNAAIDVLKQSASDQQADGIVFPGIRRGEPLSNGSMLRVLDRMGHGNLTVHGFRATFKTWASERTNFPQEVVEAALAHAIHNKLEAAYRRGDFFEKRKRLMNAWGEFCTKDVPAKSKVICFA
jgi:integrase